MLVRFAPARPEGTYVLALPIATGTLTDRIAGFAPGAREIAQRAAEAGRFDGETASIAEAFVPEEAGVRRLLLVGTGAAGDIDRGFYERASAALVARLLTSGETTLVIDVTGAAAEPSQIAVRLAFGAALRAWRHDVYRTKLSAKARPSLAEVVIVGGGPEAETLWPEFDALAEGVKFTRTLVAEPANIIYPETFVERCLPLRDLGVEIEVLDEDAMRAAGMGALLGVSQGSARPARLLVLRWDGTGGAQEPVAFVGKGVTFDTGGISIKPAGGMEDMKWDMGGAAAVAGAIKSLATRKAKANIVGICGLVENMPDGNAMRPSDVVTTMSGQTVEVINTDAEGRLVLGDAMTWTQKNFKPKVMIDLATLTGAMVISLGHEYAGIFSNNDKLAADLIKAADESGDKLWRQPLAEAYDRLIDSQIADMKNVGPREAGSITAAQFLQRFVDEGVAWAHLDIAGMAWSDKASATYDKGATGYGVRLLDRYIADTVEG